MDHVTSTASLGIRVLFFGRLKAFSLYGSQIGLLSWALVLGFHFDGLCQGLPSVFNLRNVVHSLKLEEERKEFSKRSGFNQGGLFSKSGSTFYSFQT